jgi:hypothetical protein
LPFARTFVPSRDGDLLALHTGVAAVTGQILGSMLTDHNVDNGCEPRPLLEDVKGRAVP